MCAKTKAQPTEEERKKLNCVFLAWIWRFFDYYFFRFVFSSLSLSVTVLHSVKDDRRDEITLISKEIPPFIRSVSLYLLFRIFILLRWVSVECPTSNAFIAEKKLKLIGLPLKNFASLKTNVIFVFHFFLFSLQRKILVWLHFSPEFRWNLHFFSLHRTPDRMRFEMLL